MLLSTSLCWLMSACTGGSVPGLGDTVDTATVVDSDPDTTLDDPGLVDLAGACDLDDRFGGFSAAVYQDLGYSYVEGSVTDGVVPIDVREEVLVDGECRLMRRNIPYCEPSCGAEETCDWDGACVPYPVEQDLGTVTVAGLADGVSMDPVSPGFTYFDTSVPHPAFDPGEVIELSTGGGAYEPVTLHGVGVELLELDVTLLEVQEGQELVIPWSAPTEDSYGHVRLDLNIDQHGSTPINVWCDFADDGQGVVPAALIDALVGAGVTGYPSATLTRRTIDSAGVGDGCMDFAVGALRSPDVDVIGFTPCTTDEDCPKDQTCDALLQVCE